MPIMVPKRLTDIGIRRGGVRIDMDGDASDYRFEDFKLGPVFAKPNLTPDPVMIFEIGKPIDIDIATKPYGVEFGPHQ